MPHKKGSMWIHFGLPRRWCHDRHLWLSCHHLLQLPQAHRPQARRRPAALLLLLGRLKPTVLTTVARLGRFGPQVLASAVGQLSRRRRERRGAPCVCCRRARQPLRLRRAQRCGRGATAGSHRPSPWQMSGPRLRAAHPRSRARTRPIGALLQAALTRGRHSFPPIRCGQSAGRAPGRACAGSARRYSGSAMRRAPLATQGPPAALELRHALRVPTRARRLGRGGTRRCGCR